MYPINNIIERHFGREPSQIVKLTGGDINEVYQVFLQEKSVVIKINNSQSIPKFFEKEKQSNTNFFFSNLFFSTSLK